MIKHFKFKKLLKITDFKRFIKYLLVGGIVFIIYTSMLWFFKRILNLDNFVSATIAFTGCALIHFCLDNIFTFSDSNAVYKKRILGYITVVVCNYVISTTVVYVVLSFVHDNVILANVASTSATVLIGFLFLNKIVFTKLKREGEN